LFFFPPFFCNADEYYPSAQQAIFLLEFSPLIVYLEVALPQVMDLPGNFGFSHQESPIDGPFYPRRFYFSPFWLLLLFWKAGCSSSPLVTETLRRFFFEGCLRIAFYGWKKIFFFSPSLTEEEKSPPSPEWIPRASELMLDPFS